MSVGFTVAFCVFGAGGPTRGRPLDLRLAGNLDGRDGRWVSWSTRPSLSIRMPIDALQLPHASSPGSSELWGEELWAGWAIGRDLAGGGSGVSSTDEVEQGCVGKPFEWAIQRWQTGPN